MSVDVICCYFFCGLKTCLPIKPKLTAILAQSHGEFLCRKVTTKKLRVKKWFNPNYRIKRVKLRQKMVRNQKYRTYYCLMMPVIPWPSSVKMKK